MKYISTLLLFILSLTVQAQPRSGIPINFDKHSVLRTSGANFFQSNLMNKYDIKYLKLDIAVVPGNRFIAGNCLYKVITKQPLDTFAIEFKQTMNLDSVKMNNVKINFTRNADHIYVPCNPIIATGTPLTIQFFYNGTPADGIFNGTNNNTGLTFTANVSESYKAREWFPAKQILNDKIDSTDTWITTTNPNLAGSNGLLKAVVDSPGNRKQFQWSTRYPMSYYMPCFGVGNYMDYRNYAKPKSISPDSILIQHYVVSNPAYFNSVKGQINKTPAFVEKMSELFGLYPFYKEKYGHLQADIGGGMEHQTMTTLQEFPEYLVAHELGHQWFGDNVTCGSWSDIWLNEGFASYVQVLMLEYLPDLFTGSAEIQMHDVDESVMSSPGGSVYVPAADIYDENRIFDPRLSYNKGCAALHNLRFEMQSDTFFFNTLKLYQKRFKDSFATTNDFKKVAEEVSGKDFTDFFNEWIYGEGFPTYNITYSKQSSDTLVLNVNQTTSMPSVTPLFKGLMEYKIKSNLGDTVVKVYQNATNQTFKFYYTKTPSSIEVDPNNWVVNRVGTVSPLPTKLISFTGSVVNNTSKLQWTIAEESQTDHYELQRSADGIIFNTIKNISAANQKQYGFTDVQPLSKGYYRLVIIGADGKASYSNTVILETNNNKTSITYNSLQSTLLIKANSSNNEKIQIALITIDGRKILQQERTLSTGNNEIIISLKNINAGIYIAEVLRNGERKVMTLRKEVK